MNMKILLLFIITVNNQINATVTDKQYASMPDLFHQDNYDNCMMRQDEAFYCFITYVLEPVDKENPSEIWHIIKSVSDIKTNYRHDHIRHGICIPQTCPEVTRSHENDPLLRKAVESCYNKNFKPLGLQGIISEIRCETLESKYPVDWMDIVCCILFFAYILFVLFATYYETLARYKTSEEYKNIISTPTGKILAAFSITKNWIKLKTIKSTPEVEQLRCIQGIRVYNTSLVICCHTLLSFLAIPVANTRYIETLHENKARVIFASGPLCVATFFFLSSFLISNALFEYMKDKKGLSMKICITAFANRLFRLTPNLLVIVLFHATWWRHLGNGPYWNHFVITEYNNCRKNGWTNILYINNWVDFHNMCVPVTWYLGLDTQYFLLSLFFIWMLKAYEQFFWRIIGVALSLNILGTFLQNYYYDFDALILPDPERHYGLYRMLSSRESHYQLGSFIGNMAGPLMGIATGYYFCCHKNQKLEDRIFTSKFGIFIWWILSFGLALSFVIIPGFIILQDTTAHNAFWASIYVAVSRPLFTFSIGIGLIGLTNRVGGLALRICEWPPTYVLGRLSLSAYLVHMSIVVTRSATARFSKYISEFELFMAACGDIVAVYICATFLTLFIELPLGELQKFIFVQTEENGENKLKKEEKTI